MGIKKITCFVCDSESPQIVCDTCIESGIQSLEEYHDLKYGKYLATSSKKIVPSVPSESHTD